MPPLSPNLDVKGRPEELVSAEEARRGVQLQGGLLLERLPPAALLVLFGGAEVFFGLHLVQNRVEHFALKAAQIQRGNGLPALDAQQRDLRRGAKRRRHGRLLRTTDKTLLLLPLCGRGKQ